MAWLVMFGLLVCALAWIVSGAALVLHPEQARAGFAWFVPEPRRKNTAMGVLALGALLLFGALTGAVTFWLPFVIGALSLAKGLYILMADPQAVEQRIGRWLDGLNEESSRALGLLVFALGIALLVWLAGGVCPSGAGCHVG